MAIKNMHVRLKVKNFVFLTLLSMNQSLLWGEKNLVSLETRQDDFKGLVTIFVAVLSRNFDRGRLA